MVTDETAMRLLCATREQLHGKPTRQVVPFEVAEKAGINPYQREYDEPVRYLVDNGYICNHHARPPRPRASHPSRRSLSHVVRNLFAAALAGMSSGESSSRCL